MNRKMMTLVLSSLMGLSINLISSDNFSEVKKFLTTAVISDLQDAKKREAVNAEVLDRYSTLNILGLSRSNMRLSGLIDISRLADISQAQAEPLYRRRAFLGSLLPRIQNARNNSELLIIVQDIAKSYRERMEITQLTDAFLLESTRIQIQHAKK